MSILFKFVSSSRAVVNLAAGSLKFTPIDQLNDPSELTSIMDHSSVLESLNVLRRNGFSNIQFEWLHCQSAILDLLAPEEKELNVPKTISEANSYLSLPAYDNLDYMEKKLSATIMAIRSKVGVLSLSERYDCLPMWAHYASNAAGYVVVFDKLNEVFPGDSTGSLNALKPVNYTDWFSGMTFDPSTQDNLFFSKLSDWSYEKEWRVVTALQACRRSDDGSLFLKDVDRKHIRAIICGWRVPSTDVSSLKVELNKNNAKTQIICSTFENGKIKLLDDIPELR